MELVAPEGRLITGKAVAISACMTVPLFLTQNHGTVMQAEIATAFPVMSFASGATNSMRGAPHLSALANPMAVDGGGPPRDTGRLPPDSPPQPPAPAQSPPARTLLSLS